MKTKRRRRRNRKKRRRQISNRRRITKDYNAFLKAADLFGWYLPRLFAWSNLTTLLVRGKQ